MRWKTILCGQFQCLAGFSLSFGLELPEGSSWCSKSPPPDALSLSVFFFFSGSSLFLPVNLPDASLSLHPLFILLLDLIFFLHLPFFLLHLPSSNSPLTQLTHSIYTHSTISIPLLIVCHFPFFYYFFFFSTLSSDSLSFSFFLLFYYFHFIIIFLFYYFFLFMFQTNNTKFT